MMFIGLCFGLNEKCILLDGIVGISDMFMFIGFKNV